MEDASLMWQGKVVVVRNTFLDVDDPPPEGTVVKRGQTCPPTVGRLGGQEDADWQNGREEEEEEEEEEEDGEEPGPLPVAVATPSPAAAAVDDTPPPEHELVKMTTVDWYEQEEEWNWGGGANNNQQPNHGQLPPPEPATQPMASAPTMATAAPCHMPAQAVVMSGGPMPQPLYTPGMQPAQMPMVPMVPMMVPIGADGQPVLPQQVRQPDRGARWPVAAASQTGPVAMPVAGQIAVEANFPAAMASGSGFMASGDPSAPQPHTLTRAQSVSSGNYRIHWTVDARKLRGNDKQAVSPPFELSFGHNYPSVIFKMMLYPKVVSDSKGGASFKKARGHGFVQVKCEAELSEAIANVDWRVTIGREKPRGPVHHNFALSAVSRLKKDEEEWDFNTAVDQESGTFVLCLEIIPRLS